MTNERVMNVPRFLLSSPWTVALFLGAISVALVELGDGWDFLKAVHPLVLGVMSVGLTLWLLYALVPKITVHLMDTFDLQLPTGDSSVPLVGLGMRFVTVLLGPSAIYLSLMALREEPGHGWEIAGAVLIGLVLGALVRRSVTLINIMWHTYPEDEIRKGILRTGAYPQAAREKLQDVFYTIAEDDNLDRKRIRLGRLNLATRALRNTNYDPHQFELRTRTAATVSGIEREQELRRARRAAELEDVAFETKVSEQRAQQRKFDNLNHPKAGPTPETLRSRIRSRINSAVGAHQAAEDLCDDEEERCERAGWDEDSIARHMARFRAAAVQAAEDEANW